MLAHARWTVATLMPLSGDHSRTYGTAVPEVHPAASARRGRHCRSSTARTLEGRSARPPDIVALWPSAARCHSRRWQSRSPHEHEPIVLQVGGLDLRQPLVIRELDAACPLAQTGDCSRGEQTSSWMAGLSVSSGVDGNISSTAGGSRSVVCLPYARAAGHDIAFTSR